MNRIERIERIVSRLQKSIDDLTAHIEAEKVTVPPVKPFKSDVNMMLAMVSDAVSSSKKYVYLSDMVKLLDVNNMHISNRKLKALLLQQGYRVEVGGTKRSNVVFKPDAFYIVHSI